MFNHKRIVVKSNLFLLCFLLVGSFALSAQTVEFGGLDKSPLDAAHYPASSAFKNYLSADDPDREQKIKVVYSRPGKNEREIFGSLVPYGQEWRLGANEATEVTFFQPVQIDGITVPAGSYTMFAQVYPNQWTIKLSGERFLTGTANRDFSKDLVSVNIPVERVATPREKLTIGFEKVDTDHVNMVFAWDQTMARLPINLNAPSLAGEDASPMDLVQFPSLSRRLNMVKAEELEANQPQVRVVYSRPQMKGRKIFGEMLPYGNLWRVGANETTELTFFKDVTIGGKDIRAGRYGLFAVVNDGSWEFIIHKNVQSWGDGNHDEKDNIVKVSAKTEKTPTTLEALSMALVEKGDMVELVVGWENTMARLPIKVKQ